MKDIFPQISLAALASSSLKTEHHSYKVKINSEGTQVPTRDATESPETGLRASHRAFRTERSHKVVRGHLIAKRCG